MSTLLLSDIPGAEGNGLGFITSFWAGVIFQHPGFPCVVGSKDTEQLSVSKSNICIILKTGSFYMENTTTHEHRRVQLWLASRETTSITFSVSHCWMSYSSLWCCCFSPFPQQSCCCLPAAWLPGSTWGRCPSWGNREHWRKSTCTGWQAAWQQEVSSNPTAHVLTALLASTACKKQPAAGLRSLKGILNLSQQ